jgi:7-cyano-7-deazaguanine reductase
MSRMPLGRKAILPQGRDPSVLFPIGRRPCPVPVHGYDLWRCYELSWLNHRGRPEAGILELAYPVTSLSIVESKSLKLYLGGLANERFGSGPELEEVLRHDLANVLAPGWMEVRIIGPRAFPDMMPEEQVEGTCLDDLDLAMGDLAGPDPSMLSIGQNLQEETLHTDLLRTLCPITGQPDWASVVICYKGAALGHGSLLRYLCSYRNHQGFAEEVCERIYCDIMTRCAPERLLVTCFYTRRGGIDITPHRRTDPVGPEGVERKRLVRQ